MDAYAVIDLDSVLGGALGRATDPTQGIVMALAQAERESGWVVAGGRATMNRATHAQVGEDLYRELARRNVVTAVVETRKEQADKDLFLHAALAAGDGMRRYIVLSADTDFAQATTAVRGRFPDVEALVVVAQATPGLRHAYGAGVRVLELARLAPTRAGDDVGVGQAVMLVCDVCGQRRPLERALKKHICPRCGCRMRTGGNIVPMGAIPFRDGPLVQVWRERRLVKLAVLRAHSTMFVRREAEETRDPNSVGIGDFVAEPRRISNQCLQIVRVSDREWTILPLSHRNGVYLRQVATGPDGLPRADYRELGVQSSYALTHGDEIYLNHPETEAENSMRLQFLNPPPRREG